MATLQSGMQAGSLVTSAYTALARPGTMGRQPPFHDLSTIYARRAVTVVQTTSRKGRHTALPVSADFPSVPQYARTSLSVQHAGLFCFFLLIMCLASTVPQSLRCGAVPPECRYLAGNAGCTARNLCNGRLDANVAHCGHIPPKKPALP